MRFTAPGTHRGESEEVDEVFRAFIEGQAEDSPISAEEEKVVEEFASRISTSWFRSVKQIYMTGSECAEAQGRLGPKARRALLNKLPFGASTFSKLVQIGNDHRIPKIIKHLPPSFTSIYCITRLSTSELKAGLRAGIVKTDATREEIQQLRGNASSKTGITRAKPSTGAPAKATNVTSTEHELPEQNDDLDFSSADEDEANATESSEQGDSDIYKTLVADWKDYGLRRRAWLATPPGVRPKFVQLLLGEPFKPRCATKK
jgi:hypothetical protein